jgi:hypothetical protein
MVRYRCVGTHKGQTAELVTFYVRLLLAILPAINLHRHPGVIMGLQKTAVVQWLLQHPKEFAAIVVEHASDQAIKSWRNRRAPGEGEPDAMRPSLSACQDILTRFMQFLQRESSLRPLVAYQT